MCVFYAVIKPTLGNIIRRGGVMNKQEAIEKVKELGDFYRNAFGGTVKMAPVGPIIDTISQIHEPQKPVIPKFVAEWIEWCKRSGWHLQKVLSRLDDDEKVGDWAYDENDDLINEKVDIFARAWLDGYTVEKEKLYTVEIPNPALDNSECVIVLKRIRGRVCLVNTYDYMGRELSDEYQLTESEIKQDFDFLWQFAKTVEEK